MESKTEMVKRQLKKISLPFLVILSLLASSISICACAHHQEKTEASMPLCHQNSPMIMQEDSHESSTVAIETCILESECCCLQPAPRTFAKSENLKIEKQTVAVLPAARIEIKAITKEVSFKAAGFEPPFYLSDSFHNLSPGRAPPRL